MNDTSQNNTKKVHRKALEKRYLANVCHALHQYAINGGVMRIVTTHSDEDPITAGRILLHIEDWEEFRRLLEPSSVPPEVA